MINFKQLIMILILIHFVTSNQTCCYSTDILSNNQVTNKLKYIIVPDQTELQMIKRLIIQKSDEICNQTNTYFTCSYQANCQPMQNQTLSQLLKIPDYIKMVPIFVLRDNFYGTDGPNVFKVEIQDLLKKYNLEIKLGSEVFSFMYLYKNTLYSYSKMPKNAQLLCFLSQSQKLSNSHFLIIKDQLLDKLVVFENL